MDVREKGINLIEGHLHIASRAESWDMLRDHIRSVSTLLGFLEDLHVLTIHEYNSYYAQAFTLMREYEFKEGK